MKKKNSWTDLLHDHLKAEVSSDEIPEGAKCAKDLSSEWGCSEGTAWRRLRQLVKDDMVIRHAVRNNGYLVYYYTIK